MISYLRGTPIHKDEKSAVILAGNVGYKIFASLSLLSTLDTEKEIAIWTYLAVREDALDLYGFETKDELDFFSLLITISGIGPKTAIGILNVTTPAAIKKAVTSGDTSHLTKVSGIGKKVAEKIVVELKGKFGEDNENEVSLRDEVEALEALKALGYNHRDAREALKSIDSKISDTGERIKHALKILGK